jgi:2-isopropylmalate synthase
MLVQPNKAIVGANAFAHQSGIHQDGMLKHGETYEIMKPSVVGQPSTSIVLGKLSGRNGLRSRLEDLGYSEIVLDAERFNAFFVKFKALADTKNQVHDHDLIALISEEGNREQKPLLILRDLQVVSSGHQRPDDSGMHDAPTATATIVLQDYRGLVDSPTILMDAALGSGPIQAIFKCINRLLQLDEKVELVGFDVKSVTEGADALGSVHVRLRARQDDMSQGEKSLYFQGYGTNCDILTASALAYLDAVNRMENKQ